MCAAVRGMDVVGKRKNQLVKAFRVLQGDFRRGIFILRSSGKMNNFRVDHLNGLFLVQVVHEGAYAALVTEFAVQDILRIPLIRKLNTDAGIEKGLFPQAGLQRLIFINRGLPENFRVCLEPHIRTVHPAVFYGALFFQLRYGFAAFKALFVNHTVADDTDFQPL